MEPPTPSPPFRPHQIGEVAIRCTDMGAMVRFYRDVIGLCVLSGGEDAAITFLKVSDGTDGHTNVVALFHHTAGRAELHATNESPPATGAGSSLHHIALSLPFAEQAAAMEWYGRLGLDFRVQHFDWIGWRGIFTRDPEGNTVELVARDPDWKPPDGP